MTAQEEILGPGGGWALNDVVVDTIRHWLPCAWETRNAVAAKARAGASEFADNQAPPPDEAARGSRPTASTW